MTTPTLSARLAGFFQQPLASVTSFGTHLRGSIARLRPALRTLTMALVTGAILTAALAPAAMAGPVKLADSEVAAATGLKNERASAGSIVGLRHWQGADAGSLQAAGSMFASIEAAAPDFVTLNDLHAINPDAVFLVQHDADANQMIFNIGASTNSASVTDAEGAEALAELAQTGSFVTLAGSTMVNMDNLTAVDVTSDGVVLKSGDVKEAFGLSATQRQDFLDRLQASGDYAVSDIDGAVRLSSIGHATIDNGKLKLISHGDTVRLGGMTATEMQRVMTKLAQGQDWVRATGNDVLAISAVRSIELRQSGFAAHIGSKVVDMDMTRAQQKALIDATRDTGRFLQIGPKQLVNVDSIGMITPGVEHADYYMDGKTRMTRWEDFENRWGDRVNADYYNMLINDLRNHPDFVRVTGNTYLNLNSVAALQWVEKGPAEGFGKAVLTTTQGQYNIDMNRRTEGTFLAKMKQDDRFIAVGHDLIHKNAFGQMWHNGERQGMRYTVGEVTFSNDEITQGTAELMGQLLAQNAPDLKQLGKTLVDLDAVAQLRYTDGKLQWQLGKQLFDVEMSREDARKVMDDVANEVNGKRASLDAAPQATRHAALSGADAMGGFVHFVLEGNNGEKIIAKLPAPNSDTSPKLG